MQLAPGTIVDGKYRIVRLLGSGAMGAVYEGENVRIQRRVAIKTLHADLTRKRDAVMRFEREAQAAGRIGSEHIVEVLDVGELPDGGRYLVMEYCDGTTLGERLKARGRLAPSEIVPILVQLLAGLAAAHDKGIIHRDLKPANVFLLKHRNGQPDFVKILDFGVSKFSVLGEEASMTATGMVLGTPFYMAPEQAKGSRDVDLRSDLYAVGVILYECLTGQVPYNAATFNELLFKIVLEAPPPPERFAPDLDPHLSHVLRKAMAHEPRERYQSALELQHALGEWLARSSSAGRLPAVAPPKAIGPGGTMMIDAHAVLAKAGVPGPWGPAPPAPPAPQADFTSTRLLPEGTAPEPEAPTGIYGPPPPPPVPPGPTPPPTQASWADTSTEIPTTRSWVVPVTVFAFAALVGGAAAAALLLRSPSKPASAESPSVTTAPPAPPPVEPSATEAPAASAEPPPPADSSVAPASGTDTPAHPSLPGTTRVPRPAPSASAKAAPSAAPSAGRSGRQITDEL